MTESTTATWGAIAAETPWEVEVATFGVPFKMVFKHTSAARAASQNIIVRVTDEDGVVGYGEGCPRD